MSPLPLNFILTTYLGRFVFSAKTIQLSSNGTKTFVWNITGGPPCTLGVVAICTEFSTYDFGISSIFFINFNSDNTSFLMGEFASTKDHPLKPITHFGV
jgi:hypothetical protein